MTEPTKEERMMIVQALAKGAAWSAENASHPGPYFGMYARRVRSLLSRALETLNDALDQLEAER
jgi:hypothetical protein